MIFNPTPIDGAYLIELEPFADDRGFFARSFCAREFAERGLEPAVAQCNLSFNHRAGTLRGLHYQLPPAAETKLVRCTSGAIHDVIVDLRRESKSYLRHYGVELSASNRRALYVPGRVAHGYQSLVDATEVSYQVGEFYTPGAERGLPYDDPAFAIPWPLAVTTMSEKDRAWPRFDPEAVAP